MEELRPSEVLRHDRETPWSVRQTEAFIAKVHGSVEKVKAS
jgi:hypothetical protein